MKYAYLTRNVWILSLVSLFTDVSSEMLYPVMPLFLKSIGFSVVIIGLLEGVAEAVAGLSKGYFGQWSDHCERRLPFVQVGYALSAISKPMMVAFTWAWWVFLARTLDRLGKGMRTGARDALLSDEATPTTKGRVFGFHRGMDTLGAVIGPVLALLYLHYFPGDYRTLFLAAFAPGFIAVAATFLVRERPQIEPAPRHFSTWNLTAFATYWRKGPTAYRRLTGGLLVFALFNSSDVFLLLKAKEIGVGDTGVVGLYIFYNLVYAAAAFPMGALADRLGIRRVLVGGLLVFSLVYVGMGLTTEGWVVGALFFLYGLYAAATEGVSKAWISNICARKDTATALGTFTAFQSIAALVASSFTGLLWHQFGAAVAFGVSAVIAAGVSIYIAVVPLQVGPQRTNATEPETTSVRPSHSSNSAQNR
ncbi:MAG: MFS transporter [Saprospiraceae bacterium]|nr:MFS transporter [Saprospiraceae bacterium]MDW8483995.1 MFS transporter [Saprospiraceae bacterium]